MTIRHIDLTFEMQDGKMTQIHANHEYPSWDLNLLREIEERYVSELRNGRMAVGAFDGHTLVGFGVLAYQWQGDHRDYERAGRRST